MSSSDNVVQFPYFFKRCDLMETESSFIVKLDAPGVEFKDIAVEFHHGISFAFKHQSMVIISVERTGRFSRKILLPEGVNITAVPTYSTTNGVITLTVGKLMPSLQYGELTSVYPRTDMIELPDKLVYLMDLPGLDEEKVKLEIVDLTMGGRLLSELRITGKWESDFEGAFLCSGSRLSHSFCRGYILPTEVKGVRIENLQWEMKNGVLTVYVPKTARMAKRADTTPAESGGV